MEKFCKDIAVKPEDIVMLVLAWKMKAKQMGYFSQEEWLQGMTDIKYYFCRLHSLKLYSIFAMFQL